MKKHTRHLILALAATLGVAAVPVTHAADSPAVETLRGRDVSAPELDSKVYRQERDGPPIPRDFVQQPPLIPHVTAGYTITANFNKCMDCHSWTRYKESGATKVSLTHFKDRDGRELSNISPRRYFCTQCHVPQTDAKPLVNNTFQRAEGLR